MKISSDGWTRLAMTLAAGSSLRILHVDYNVICDTVACCLVTALPGAKKLETLDMECTGLTDATGQVIRLVGQHLCSSILSEYFITIMLSTRESRKVTNARLCLTIVLPGKRMNASKNI